MAYKVFVSTTTDEPSLKYAQVVKTALWRINEFPLTTVSITDIPAANLKSDPIEVIRRILDGAQIFIGVYHDEYGDIPSGYGHSWIEMEYDYARQLSLNCLIFMHESHVNTGSEQMQNFKRKLAEAHIINTFKSEEELAAQVVVNVSKSKVLSKITKLRPPSPQNFVPEGAMRDLPKPGLPIPPSLPTLPTPGEDQFDALVQRAFNVIQDDIEDIVKRSIELHEAQNKLQQAANLSDGHLHIKPLWGPPQVSSQFQSDIFMIMPFRPEYDTVYQNIIKPTTAELNLTIKRGDDFTSLSGAIINEVWAAINACRLVIVETTDVNANVYYELGIAHTLGKPAILLTQLQNDDDFPFDIRHLRFIVYQNTDAGGKKLEADLKKAIIWLLNDLQEAAKK